MKRKKNKVKLQSLRALAKAKVEGVLILLAVEKLNFDNEEAPRAKDKVRNITELKYLFMKV